MLDRADQERSEGRIALGPRFLVITLETETAIAGAAHLDVVLGPTSWRAAQLDELEQDDASAANGPLSDVEGGDIALLAVEEQTDAALARYEDVTTRLTARGLRVVLVVDARAPTAERRLFSVGAEMVLLWPLSDEAVTRLLKAGRSDAPPSSPGEGGSGNEGRPWERRREEVEPLVSPPGPGPDAHAVAAPSAAYSFASNPPPGHAAAASGGAAARAEPPLTRAPGAGASASAEAPGGGADLAGHIAPARRAPPLEAAPRQAPDAPGGAGSVISVFRAVGGAGATTLAVNLAWELAAEIGGADSLADDRGAEGRRAGSGGVALLDLDLQGGGATSHLELRRSEAAESLLIGDGPLSMETALGAMTRRGGLAVLPAPAAMMPLDAAPAERIDQLLAHLASFFAYVVIDTPIALTVWSEPVLRRSDRAFLMARGLSLHEAGAVARLERALEGEGVSTKAMELVLNGAPGGLDWSRKARLKKFEALSGRRVAHHLAEGGEAPMDAADAGAPLGEIERRNPLRLSIRKLAEALRSEWAIAARA